MNNQVLNEVLNSKKICIFGVSRKEKFGNMVYDHLKKNNYKVFPINPKMTEFDGEKCFPNLESIPEKPDLAILAVKADKSLEILQQCVKSGLNRVFLVSGSSNKEVLDFCRKNNINGIHKSCPFMIFKPFGFHNFHRFVNSLLAIKPKTIF